MSRTFLLGLAILVLLLPAVVCGQLPGSLPGPSGGGNTPPMQAPMAPAMPETLRAAITLPDGLPPCVGVEVPADSASFGQPTDLVLWFGNEALSAPSAEVTSSAPWLQLGTLRAGEMAGSLRLAVRPYALDFFQVQVGEALGPVVPMTGTGRDLSRTSGVRIPRLWKTRWWILGLMALGAALILWGVLRLWQRRRRLEPLKPWQPAPGAWLVAAPRLRHLLAEDDEAARDTHLFCDRLAAQVRAFLAARYLVPALEMTGPEIQTGLRARSFPEQPAARLTRLVAELDNHRYNPQAPDTLWCRQQAARFFAAMAEVRIVPRYVRVAPPVLREAELAWAWLQDPANLAPAEASHAGGGD